MKHYILLDNSPEEVFSFIEKMSNKFPVYKMFETKLFLFIRMLLIDGIKTAIKTTQYKETQKTLILQPGTKLGPFTFIEVAFPKKYWFSLESLFFNCQTGYVITKNGTQTQLNLDLISENPSKIETLWWFFIKPIHGLMSRKVLKEIQKSLKSHKTFSASSKSHRK